MAKTTIAKMLEEVEEKFRCLEELVEALESENAMLREALAEALSSEESLPHKKQIMEEVGLVTYDQVIKDTYFEKKKHIVSRAMNALMRGSASHFGVKYLNWIQGKNPADLVKTRNLGISGMAITILVCERYGIALDMRFEDKKIMSMVEKYRAELEVE